MDTQKQSVVDRIRQATNILVTVSSNPSVDQLAACIGLTLALNKLDKHGTAVFSGQVPSTIEFLQPEETIEKNTDSLRDFIIALDKSKADKLRYKVEENLVRIFITPYKTSISDKDLIFSQGDFNVDVVVALGVHEQQDLDTAITAHGRILHDATVISINTNGQGDLGTLNWVDGQASSLSEMIVGLIDALDDKAIDNQIATALLTGIVAETDRFSNDKTTSTTMSMSAQLMSAGANQQLVATKLEEKVEPSRSAAPTEPSIEPESPPEEAKAADGTLEIEHDEGKPHDDENSSDHNNGIPNDPGQGIEPGPAPAVGDADENGSTTAQHQPLAAEPELQPEITLPQPVHEEEKGILGDEHQIHVDEHGTLQLAGDQSVPGESHIINSNSRLIMEPPALGGPLTANTMPEGLDPGLDSLTMPAANPQLLSRDEQPSYAAAPNNIPLLGNHHDEAKAEKNTELPVAPDPVTIKPEKKLEPVPDAPAPDDIMSLLKNESQEQEATPPAPSPEHNAETRPAAPQQTIVVPPVPSGKTLSDLEREMGSPHAAVGLTTPSPAVPSSDSSLPPLTTDFPPIVDTQSVAGPAHNPDAESPSASPKPQPAGQTDPSVDSARDAVQAAINSMPLSQQQLEPLQALNAQPVGSPLHEQPSTTPAPAKPEPANNGLQLPSIPGANTQPQSTLPADPNAPPTVPPPFTPNLFPS